jgi:hypothetical protein
LGDGSYYQDRDEDQYLDSWEFTRDQDRMMGVELPNRYYQDRHVPTKRAIMEAMAQSAQRTAAEQQARELGGTLSPDGSTILIPVMTASQKVEAKSRYDINKDAKVGDAIECACCGKKLTKTNYQQAFCPPIKSRRGKRYKCKDQYWNATVPERAARANAWMPR